MGTFREARQSEKSDRSAGDRAQHRKKVREAIRGTISDIIAEESIIGKDKDRIIKVPIRGIREYRFIYGENEGGVAQGNGESQPGQVVGQVKREGLKGDEDRAGDRPGQDYYETAVTIDELVDILFEDLELPDQEKKKLREIVIDDRRKPSGSKKVGIPAHLLKRKSARQRLREMIAAGISGKALEQIMDLFDEEGLISTEDLDKLPPQFKRHVRPVPGDSLKRHRIRFPFNPKEHLRYKRHKIKPRRESNAVVICMMDTSGSMDTMKKYLARTFFFLLYQFVVTKYRNVKIVFIAHHTEAQEVTEEEFFHKGESGGTFISSAYVKALEIIQERYHPSLWNVYAFHCSDGDNFESDNQVALKVAKELCEVCNLFGYGEIKPLGSRFYESSMLNLFKPLESEGFATVLIERKEDVYPTFKSLLQKDKAKTTEEVA